MVADRDMHQPQSKSAKWSAAQGWRGNLGKPNLPRFICAAQTIATPWPACCVQQHSDTWRTESITCNIRMSLQVALPVQHRVGGAAWASQFCIACMRQSWPICGQTAHGSWQGHASATKQVCQMFCSTGLAGQFGQTKSASLYLCHSNHCNSLTCMLCARTFWHLTDRKHHLQHQNESASCLTCPAQGWWGCLGKPILHRMHAPILANLWANGSW